MQIWILYLSDMDIESVDSVYSSKEAANQAASYYIEHGYRQDEVRIEGWDVKDKFSS